MRLFYIFLRFSGLVIGILDVCFVCSVGGFGCDWLVLGFVCVGFFLLMVWVCFLFDFGWV